VERLSWRDLGARPLVFPALGLGLGATFADPTSPSRAEFLALGAGLALLALLLNRRAGAHLAVLLGCVLAGAGLARQEARVLAPPGLFGAPVLLEGEVERVDPFPDAPRVLLRVAREGSQHT
jgi:competence protein ComEC